MPIIKREDFGTTRAPDWCKIEGGIAAMGYFALQDDQPVEPHFHDAEEFWFVLEGKARVATDGDEYIVGPGDVLCTHMGEEHAIFEVLELPYAHVWIECNLRGQRRRGHLHRGEDD